ncbi:MULTISPECIES: hypothetical protein [Microbacterium]|uniref:Uncharacterized protein n=1 Tax=Microbacterium hominis TaxID=162426 RepID=A0A2K9D6Z8_9MICO|nr:MULTISPECIES: hypothetical protein [Microbacterium]AUG28662.1 hypothetical protein CXR34_03740 [Microbacterium hominis]
MRVSELSFPVALRLINTVAPFDGVRVAASDDALHAAGAFIVYDTGAGPQYGYIDTRLARDVRGRRWGMGLLYDVDPTASAENVRSPLDRRFRERAEVEFEDAGEL